MKIISNKDINYSINNDINSFIKDSELYYENQLSQVVKSIIEKSNKSPIILLSGPSGSGKTTTAKYLQESFIKKDINTHIISMDNYFLSLKDARVEYNEDGSVNFESPYRIDIALFKEHLESLLLGKVVYTPIFDFTKHSRSLDSEELSLNKGELLIIEGIHAFSPLFMNDYTSISNYVYIDTMTSIEYDNKIFNSSYVRLIRRIIRDNIFRGRSIIDTIKMFSSVSLGETNYILPFKKYAQYHINTFLDYELSIYCSYLLNELIELKNKYDEYDCIYSIIEMMKKVSAINSCYAPKHSIIREFIG